MRKRGEDSMNDDQLDLGAPFDFAAPWPSDGGAPGPRRPDACRLRPEARHDRRKGVYLLSSKETRSTKAGQAVLQAQAERPHRHGRLHGLGGRRHGRRPEDGRPGGSQRPGDRVPGQSRNWRRPGSRPPPPGAADPRDFLPSTYRDVDELKGFLQFHIDSVHDRDYAALLQTIFGDAEFFEIFTTAPAAKVYHHAYLGGLLEHTVAVAEMCDFVGQQYGRIDRDLLLTAALLHDVGKTRELSFETTIDFTDAGRFLGHVIQGVTLISEKARSCRRSPRPSCSNCCTASSATTASWSGARPSAPRPSRP